MLEGFCKEDRATNKESPVEVDVPEYLAEMGRCDTASELFKSVGDNSFMEYYYLLRVGEYTVKEAIISLHRMSSSNWKIVDF